MLPFRLDRGVETDAGEGLYALDGDLIRSCGFGASLFVEMSGFTQEIEVKPPLGPPRPILLSGRCERGAVGMGMLDIEPRAGPEGTVCAGAVGILGAEGGAARFVDVEPNAGTCGGGVAEGCVRRPQPGSGDGFRA
jgi:hypothetical protein